MEYGLTSTVQKRLKIEKTILAGNETDPRFWWEVNLTKLQNRNVFPDGWRSKNNEDPWKEGSGWIKSHHNRTAISPMGVRGRFDPESAYGIIE